MFEPPSFPGGFVASIHDQAPAGKTCADPPQRRLLGGSGGVCLKVDAPFRQVFGRRPAVMGYVSLSVEGCIIQAGHRGVG